MRELRKKQKKMYKFMQIFLSFAAIFLIVYIGAQPYAAKYSNILAIVLGYLCDALVIGAMVLIFMYYSKYSKSDNYLSRIENELSDAGYYYTSRTEKTYEDYSSAMIDDFKSCGYSVDTNLNIDDFDFSVRAYKKKEFFYVANVDDLNRNDVLAYSDVAFNDITVHNLKRKGDGVICFLTNKAEDDAVAISKVITPFGKKEQLKISYAIAEISTGRVYFLGNMPTKCQQLTAAFVMNCDVPIKEEYIGKERLPFQDELEEKMKTFTIAEYKNGTFFAH